MLHQLLEISFRKLQFPPFLIKYFRRNIEVFVHNFLIAEYQIPNT